MIAASCKSGGHRRGRRSKQWRTGRQSNDAAVTVATQPGVGLNRRVQFDLFQKQQLLRASDSIAVGQRNVPLAFIVNHRARRYILRVRPDGTARVTVPRLGSFSAARELANRNILWIDQQLQRLAARPVADSVWTIGSAILFRGETVRIVAGRDPEIGRASCRERVQ